MIKKRAFYSLSDRLTNFKDNKNQKVILFGTIGDNLVLKQVLWSQWARFFFIRTSNSYK